MYGKLREESPDVLGQDEAEQCAYLQRHFLSFYGTDARSPYIPLAGCGPWIVTLHGAILHDSGGYGMLGFGHAPDSITAPLGQAWVMANVMTASLSQNRFSELLRKEIGQKRGKCPFTKFVCLNSGSEAMTLSARFSDLNAFNLTQPGARHAGKKIKYLGLKGGFHGRTDPAARVSDSCMETYQNHLASFRGSDTLETVTPNDLAGLRKAFTKAETDGIFFESFFIEPVMGEGEPGIALTREFYDLARELTLKHGALLIVDSVQAGFRATGYLSILDYPGFEHCVPPDIETYSKALNAGQFPLSVIALTAEAAQLYCTGIYGNTMTTNPRGMEIGSAVLSAMSGATRVNIRERGKEFIAKLNELAEEFPELILKVQGCGLIICAELDGRVCKVTGPNGLEERLRCGGVVMIHGGHNGLRFTPHFQITSSEIDLIVSVVRSVLQEQMAVCA